MYPLYNTDLEKLKKEAYDAGRKAGFIAGYAAATNKAPNDVEAAYEQGQRDAAKLVPVRKNGVGY